MKIISERRLARNLSEIFDSVARGGNPVVIRRKNGQAIAMISPSDYQAVLGAEIMQKPRQKARRSRPLHKHTGSSF